jgi:hypothetical protein
MSRKKIRFKVRKERAVLSDVLPFETPVSFTNRHFYQFLVDWKIQLTDEHLIWLDGGAALERLVLMLFGYKYDASKLSDFVKYVGTKECEFRQYSISGTNPPKKTVIPFSYKINHKKTEFRELTVPHPRSQVQLCKFYYDYKEAILYFSNLSPFSIRRPHKVSTFRYHKDKTHYELLAEDDSEIEEDDKEYENLRSFFSYREHSNIYKFYESYKYHRCEKKYDKLLKLDISKCFDSIYTHSIVWALYGKDAVKENLNKSKSTFPAKFDGLLQNMNYGETNGIIIGPEFSRIFAELILQSVDKQLEYDLARDGKPLAHKSDYEIFRYVDDYFVFYNSDEDKKIIVEQLQHCLKTYKLQLNSAKSIVYEKPLITDITRAKKRISDLLNRELVYKLEEVIEESNTEDIKLKGSIYLRSSPLIVAFKTIIKECDVSYKDMLNYTLSIVERKCKKILQGYNKTSSAYRSEKKIVRSLSEIIDFVFFVYSVSPQVNTTIRLCRILNLVTKFISSDKISYESKHLIYKNVYDAIRLMLKKNSGNKHTQVETLYLLIALSELGKQYWLEQDILASFVGVFREAGSNEFNSSYELNYFSITVLLLYMRDKVRYNELRTFVEKTVKNKLSAKPSTFKRDAELTLLSFDLISCPYVTLSLKNEILEVHGIEDVAIRNQMLSFQNKNKGNQLWFTTWGNFDFGKELDAKQSQEVY